MSSQSVIVFGNPSSLHDQKKIRILSQLGHNVHLIEFREPGDDKAEPFFNPGAEISYHRFPPFSLRHLLRTLSTALKIRHIIQKTKTRKIVILYLDPNALWSWFKSAWKTDIILYAYGSDVLKGIPSHYNSTGPTHQILRFLFRGAIRRAYHLVGTSQALLDATEALGNTKGKLATTLIRTGVEIRELDEFCSTKPKRNIQQGEFRVFFPRLMAPIYNHEFSLQAIELLPPEIKQDTRFIFINDDNPHRDYVQSIKSMAANIDAKFDFLPSLAREDILQQFWLANLVIMTPWTDGTPVSGMEALYFNKPLILGPANYDRKIFAPPAIILDDWKPHLLTKAIEYTFNRRYHPYDTQTRVKKCCSSEIEMEKLSHIISCNHSLSLATF